MHTPICNPNYGAGVRHGPFGQKVLIFRTGFCPRLGFLVVEPGGLGRTGSRTLGTWHLAWHLAPGTWHLAPGT
jgi:hypothetical protein